MQKTFTNPVLDGCADPDVLFYEGIYYLYATNKHQHEGRIRNGL